MGITLILLLALAVAGMIMLSGCTANADKYGNGGQPYAGNGADAYDGRRQHAMGNRSGTMGRGGFGNITDTERQQMMQVWAAACAGKTSGDACTVQDALVGARGEMKGTCIARGENLTCAPSGTGGRNGTRGGFGQPPQNP